uniref:Uncharacterized protein n=1 Tax=Rousettus aegyptiacus TaxID=9407 RepID=A0A7J8D766_ROUAE|nr:hypothetical protein HJG63_008784 [Rousettus aegyptiacus]
MEFKKLRANEHTQHPDLGLQFCSSIKRTGLLGETAGSRTRAGNAQDEPRASRASRSGRNEGSAQNKPNGGSPAPSLRGARPSERPVAQTSYEFTETGQVFQKPFSLFPRSSFPAPGLLPRWVRCLRRLRVPCRTFSRITGLYPPDTNSIVFPSLAVTIKNGPRRCQTSGAGGGGVFKRPLPTLRTNALKQLPK